MTPHAHTRALPLRARSLFLMLLSDLIPLIKAEGPPLSAAAPAELTITGRPPLKAVGNNGRAAFKDAPLHMQRPWHPTCSPDWGSGALSFAEAIGGFLLFFFFFFVFGNKAEWNTCSVHMAGGCMLVCLDSVTCMCAAAWRPCRITCGVVCDLVMPARCNCCLSSMCPLRPHVHVCVFTLTLSPSWTVSSAPHCVRLGRQVNVYLV